MYLLRHIHSSTYASAYLRLLEGSVDLATPLASSQDPHSRLPTKNVDLFMVAPHDPYEALLLYCQHNLLHAALLSEEPKTL